MMIGRKNHHNCRNTWFQVQDLLILYDVVGQTCMEVDWDSWWCSRKNNQRLPKIDLLVKFHNGLHSQQPERNLKE